MTGTRRVFSAVQVAAKPLIFPQRVGINKGSSGLVHAVCRLRRTRATQVYTVVATLHSAVGRLFSILIIHCLDVRHMIVTVHRFAVVNP